MRSAALLFVLSLAVTVRGAEVSFKHDVYPIFKRHCLGCHSETKTKGKLRLDDMAALLKGGKTGPLYVNGKPDDSLLITEVSGEAPEMPENEAPLSMTKIQILRDWIAQGAKIDGLPKSEVPAVVIPAVYASAPAVASVSLSPDGRLAAAACRSEVLLFRPDEDSAPSRLPTDFDLITHVEFSPDGHLLAVAGGSPQQFGGLILFDATEGKEVSRRRLGSDTLFRGHFAPDGKTLALGGPNGAVYLIPVDEKLPPKTLELHSDWVTDVAFTPDGKWLVSGSRDKTTKVSSVESLSLLRSIDQSAEMINAVAADPLIAISGGNAKALVAYDFKLALSGVEVSGSGNGARPINNRGQYARNFEAQPEAITALATSGDRKLLAVATRAPEIRLYLTGTQARKTVLPKVPSPVLSVALSQDGTRLMLGSKTGEVQIWDTTAAKLLKSFVPVPVQQATGVAAK